MRYLYVFVGLFSVFVSSCRRENQQSPIECVIPAIVPFQPYSNPVWHPNGNLLGFNHTPLAGIAITGTSPCTWYSYFGRPDSTGFYLMNKDGTGFKRVTNFDLFAPSWSPDGNWIAFSLGSNIYKMPFTRGSFDTTRIIQLTNGGGNFYPSWTANSDTIFFDSNVGTNAAGYYVWKMASDSSGKKGFLNTGRQPFVGSNGKVYYVGLSNAIYSMDRNGLNTVQISFSGTNSLGNRPKYWQNKLFYEGDGIRTISASGRFDTQLDKPSVTYDISANGEIVYSKMEADITKYNKQIGTLWIMNADGSNKRQLTFNNF